MKKKLCLIPLLILFFLLSSPFNTYADSISPFKNTVDIQISESSLEKISFTNDEDKTKEILLTAYGYNPQTEDISKETPSLLRVDTDTFTVKAGGRISIPYEVVIPEGTEEGTYYNLLVLSPVSDTESSVVNTSHAVSQVVEINVFQKGNTNMVLPSNPGKISLEAVNKGIPLIKGAVITYTYTNTTNYVLQPEGELQIFNEEQNKEPIYIHINMEGKHLYPGETLTETFTIDSYIWSLDDLISNRIVLGRFYNGIDGGYQAEKLTIEGFKNESAVLLVAVLFLVVILSEASKRKGNKSLEYYDEDTEEDEE